MIYLKNIGENPTAAASTNAIGTIAADNLDALEAMSVLVQVQGAIGGTLNITLQDTFDGGATWNDWYRSADIAAASALTTFSVSAKSMGGSVQTVGYSTAASASGANAPALTKGTVREGPWGKSMRVVYEMGAGLSAINGTIIVRVRGYRATG